MSSSNIEDIIGSLYDMVQDARTMPLAADKCIMERDRVLDMLDEVMSKLPAELNNQNNIQIRLRLNSNVNVSGVTVASFPAGATNRIAHLSVKYNK